jgi:hypothetical protein
MIRYQINITNELLKLSYTHFIWTFLLFLLDPHFELSRVRDLAVFFGGRKEDCACIVSRGSRKVSSSALVTRLIIELNEEVLVP